MHRFLAFACLCLAVTQVATVGCSPKDTPDSTPASGDSSSDETSSADPTTLSPEDQALADAQKICPVSDEDLGSMGTPIKVMVGDRAVFICCSGCREDLLADPDKFLAKLDAAPEGE